jgi:hypothetical protein
MATAPAYASTPRLGYGQVTAANTNRDGTGTIVDILTGVAAGTRIDRVVMQAQVTTTAGMIRLYVYDGTNTRLYREVQVQAITVGASTEGWSAEIVTPDLVLPSSSHKLQASTHNAEACNVWAHGADLT